MPDHDAETVVPDSRSADVASECTAGAGPTARMEGAPLLPATIGRYRILSLLGEGGMGAVYEAEQEHPQRTVWRLCLVVAVSYELGNYRR